MKERFSSSMKKPILRRCRLSIATVHPTAHKVSVEVFANCRLKTNPLIQHFKFLNVFSKIYLQDKVQINLHSQDTGDMTLETGEATKGDKFPCDECERKFSSRVSLKRHSQIHTGQFNHFCKICRNGFNESSHFKIHMRSHEGLKYNCSQCPKSFVSKQNLMFHMSEHTGEYKFSCDKCGKGYNVRATFEKHLSCHQVS